MSLTIKRQNHRIHPCDAARKNELLSYLATRYNNKKILVVTEGSTQAVVLPNTANITLTDDAALASSGEYDLLISYDLPEKALVYMARIAKAREFALVLMDAEEQKRLYPIETLLGRTIIQEVIEGFEPSFGIAAEKKEKEEAKARRAARDETTTQRDARPKRDFKPRSQSTDTDKKGSRDEKPRDRWAKNDKKPRFIGKDENGKPIFEGKTRDRNHYIDGTPRTEAEKAYKTPYASKPKFYGKEDKNADKTVQSKEKKEFVKGEKKPFGDKKPYGDKKSFGDKKPYGDKKGFGDKKPYGGKKPAGEKKPYGDKPSSAAPAEPKRPPRRITVKSLKPSEGKE